MGILATNVTAESNSEGMKSVLIAHVEISQDITCLPVPTVPGCNDRTIILYPSISRRCWSSFANRILDSFERPVMKPHGYIDSEVSRKISIPYRVIILNQASGFSAGNGLVKSEVCANETCFGKP